MTVRSEKRRDRAEEVCRSLLVMPPCLEISSRKTYYYLRAWMRLAGEKQYHSPKKLKKNQTKD